MNSHFLTCNFSVASGYPLSVNLGILNFNDLPCLHLPVFIPRHSPSPHSIPCPLIPRNFSSCSYSWNCYHFNII